MLGHSAWWGPIDEHKNGIVFAIGFALAGRQEYDRDTQGVALG